MDSDRKSTVSSFYGHKGSMDALNTDYPSPAGRPRDDTSSFYGGGGKQGTAGYNRNSFFHTGREEPLKGGDEENEPEGGWDIYADFNNAGPRYSSALGQASFGSGQSHEYRPLAPSSKYDDSASATGPVELVTVPALGAEWQKDELRDMSKIGRKEKKAERRKGKWVAWKRGETGLCGKYFTRRFLIFFLFGLCAAIGIVLAFTIPRVPSITSNSTPLANATGDWESSIPVYFNRAPANFSFPAFADLSVNTGSNFLPLTFNHFYGKVFDLQTNREVGSGDLGHRTLPAKTFTDILLPLNFTYVATNTSDQTWANWYNACKNAAASQTGTRDAVKFRLELEMDIAGLIGSRKASTTVASADCPVELAINAS